MECVHRINRKLLPLKISMFLWWGGNNALFVYMAVHMKSLGLNVRQTGIIHSLLPIVQVSGQLGFGTVADRVNKHKLILITALFSAAIFATAILHVPSVEVPKMGLTVNEEYEKTGPTFYIYLMLRLLYELCTSTVYNLFESIAVVLVAQNRNSNFGTQRIFATIGAGVFPAMAGKILDVFSGAQADHSNNATLFYNITDNDAIPATQINQDYSVLFYLFDFIVISTAIIGIVWLRFDNRNLDCDDDDDDEEVPTLKTLLQIVIKPESVAFVLTIFCLGAFWGYTKIFVPWRMAELGSDQFLIGVNLFLSTALGFILVLFSEPILRILGHVPVMSLAFLAYFVRFIAYSYITVPEYFLIFEALEGVTYHLLWVACVTYAALLTPASLTSTVQGFVGSVHYCVGIGVGGLIGGTAISDYGPELAFRAMAIAALSCAVVSAAFYFSYTRRIQKKAKWTSNVQKKIDD